MLAFLSRRFSIIPVSAAFLYIHGILDLLFKSGYKIFLPEG